MGHTRDYPASNYVAKVNNKNTRIKYGICSKLTIKETRENWLKFLFSRRKFHFKYW